MEHTTELYRLCSLSIDDRIEHHSSHFRQMTVLSANQIGMRRGEILDPVTMGSHMRCSPCVSKPVDVGGGWQGGC